MGACKNFLENRTDGTVEELNVSANSIMKALDLCLKSNVFKFNEKIYKKQGV